MGCEIEIKAHVGENEFEDLKEKLISFKDCVFLGTIDKEDIYWAHNKQDPPVFRTRREVQNGSPRILFTSKPLKTKDYKTEYNVENEFEVSSTQWEKIIDFVKGLDFEICRLKWKRGYHFQIQRGPYSIHAELLYVRHLGNFLEAEICGEDLKDFDLQDAEKELYKLFEEIGISSDAIEEKGYNKMLTALGRQLG